MNKICTSIEQSKKLLSLGLDQSTADMAHERLTMLDKYCEIPIITEGDDHFELFPQDLPCWSLAALLELMPSYLPLYPEATEDG